MAYSFPQGGRYLYLTSLSKENATKATFRAEERECWNTESFLTPDIKKTCIVPIDFVWEPVSRQFTWQRQPLPFGEAIYRLPNISYHLTWHNCPRLIRIFCLLQVIPFVKLMWVDTLWRIFFFLSHSFKACRFSS